MALKVKKNMDFNINGTTLPPTAAVIKVTNLLTPYLIRVCETRRYDEKLNSISKKLLVKKDAFDNSKGHVQPKIGDSVLLCNQLDTDTDVPGWFRRGYISSDQNSDGTYRILLTDYGISIVSRKEDFVVCSNDSALPECLSFTVGLCNVLPAILKYNSSLKKETLIISTEWSASAIEYTKKLISAAEIIYFDPVVQDQNGRYYGEFYLNIENNMIRLSEILVLNHYAIYLEIELLNFIENVKKNAEVDKLVNNNQTMYYFNSSRELSSTQKSSNLKQRYVVKANCTRKKNLRYNELEKGKEKVMIYGGSKFECLNSTLDAKFPLEIHKAWKSLMPSCKPTKIQSYIWPAMQQGLDVVAIGTKMSGKTTGCLFAVCGLLATYSNLPQGINPSALILCSCSSEVLEINSLCTEFIQNCKTIRCVAAINGKSDRSLVAEMFNGCQILVTTPNFLIRFMDRNRKLLNFKNLQFLVLDDGDIILDKYIASINQLVKKYNIICKRELKKKMLQIIITASHWTQRIKKIASVLMDNPYICITSFIEAAIFKSIHPKIFLMNSKQKDEKIFDLLGDEYCKIRTMIVCRNSEEAKKLHTFLAKNKETVIAHENMDFVDLQGVKQYWNACISGSYPVLIGTDDILSDMEITNVTWLIHYSVSLQFKTRFSFRFSTLVDSLLMDNCNCKVTIMMDENTEVQFLHILKLMQRINTSIPENILKSVKLIEATLEKKKENYPICDNVKSRGFCDKGASCAFRHKIIAEIDAPLTNIQINDMLKLRVVSIHDVTHISARIISYIKSDTQEEIEFPNMEYMRNTMKIQEFYSHVENRKRCETIVVGNTCGLEEPIDSFKRVQILNINMEEKIGNPKYVDVRCIDNGVILYKIHVYKLLYMPEEFQKYPVQVMEIFLTDIVPHDNEHVWNNCAIEAVYQWFKENIDIRSYVTGRVNLHLGNTIWMDTLEVGTKLIGYKDIIGSSLRTELLKKDHAVVDDRHLTQIYQLCREAGFVNINGYHLNT